MADEPENQQPAPDRKLPDNADPTGIGPPPPGAATHVEKGHGITEAPRVNEAGADEGGSGQA